MCTYGFYLEGYLVKVYFKLIIGGEIEDVLMFFWLFFYIIFYSEFRIFLKIDVCNKGNFIL